MQNAATRPVLVTGACGRIASQVVQRLADAGRRVLATDRAEQPTDTARFWGSNHKGCVEFVKAELTNVEVLEGLVSRCDSVVHLGAIPGPTRLTPPGVDPGHTRRARIGLEDIPGLLLFQQNMLGSCAIFEAAARHNLRRVVFSSSLFAMGYTHDPLAFKPPYLPLDEQALPTPLEHYGLSKVASEEYAMMLARAASSKHSGPASKRPRLAEGTSFLSLRFSNIVKNDLWSELPMSAPEDACVGGALMWCYVHEHDIVDAHLAALDVPQERLDSTCETFFLVADDTRFDRPTMELIKAHWVESRPLLARPLPGFASIVSNEKAKHLLGFAPRSFRSPSVQPSPVGPTGKLESQETLGECKRRWQVFRAPSKFNLRSGETLEDAFLAFKTYGILNTTRSNVILHPTSFDAVHWELEYNVGPGKTLDTDKYFVVIINLLGNGVSLSPSNCCPNTWPKGGVDMCDNVHLQALLLDALGIDRVALIYGYSMGAMQALHWATMYPGRVDRVAAVCGNARASDYNVVFLDSLRDTLVADAGCNVDKEGRVVLSGTCEAGLKAFARIYAGWGLSMEFYRKEEWRKSSQDGRAFTSREDFVARSYEGGFANAHPLNLLAQLQTWRTADVSNILNDGLGQPAPRVFEKALGRIRAITYMMPSTTDKYFTALESQEQAALIPNCKFAPIKSIWGHRAGDPHRPGQAEDADYIRRMVWLCLQQEAPP